MMYTAQDVLDAIQGDGTQIDGENLDGERAIDMLWWDCSKDTVVDTLELGKFTVVEEVVGKKGDVEYEYGGNTWYNYLVLESEDGRFFKLPGEYDSWDAKGWDGTIEEVHKVAKTVYEWEKI